MLGYQRDEVIGRFLGEFLVPQQVDLFRQRFPVFKATGALKGAEFDMVRKDGEVITVAADGRIAYDEHGAFRRTHCVLQNITARKKDESRLAALQVQLTHASRLAALGELAAGLAHEVNQPLCTIVNFAKACKNAASGEAPDLSKICQWSDAIAMAAARSGDIVRRTLGFARSGGAVRETVAVGQIVDDAMLLVRHEAQSEKVALRQEMPDKGLAVCVAPAQIQQVLVNLLRNGIEAFGDTPSADRQVAVRARLVDGLVQVSVSDNGSGRPEAELPKIFEPFYTTKPQGLGLGLPISKTIIEDHGGRIWAEANQSGGLTIHFSLPAGKDKP
jgi:two-component system sensor kinase FixL